ncbi:PilN domain-containing protein [Candidatus Nomurabacteria bacterium]|nr:PilN domain-containing protein [Candidatus Nomurabacteria bacterium]
MMNLIPPQAKRVVTAEYWVRVFTVWLWLLSLGLLISLVLSVPVHFLMGGINKSLSGKFDEVKKQQEQYDAAVAETKEFNTRLKLLTRGPVLVPHSIIINALDDIGGLAVSIDQVTFKADATSVDIVGHAATRADLSNFASALEEHEFFSNVELPISNLAKDRDITFVMSVELAES